MIARNTTSEKLYKALAMINEKYEGNVVFKREPEAISSKAIRFTLTVKRSKLPGGRIGHTGRAISAACWHVHGEFFDTLFTLSPEAIVKAGTKTITQEAGNWEDWNIGSIMQPMYYSEACNC